MSAARSIFMRATRSMRVLSKISSALLSIAIRAKRRRKRLPERNHANPRTDRERDHAHLVLRAVMTGRRSIGDREAAGEGARSQWEGECHDRGKIDDWLARLWPGRDGVGCALPRVGKLRSGTAGAQEFSRPHRAG